MPVAAVFVDAGVVCVAGFTAITAGFFPVTALPPVLPVEPVLEPVEFCAVDCCALVFEVDMAGVAFFPAVEFAEVAGFLPAAV